MTRIDLPGGGSILAPSGYATSQRRSFRRSSIVLYRKLKNTMGGYEECDGLINVARSEGFADLETFAIETESAATTRWLHGNLKPGWTSFESEKFPIQHGQGPFGAERIQELTVNTTGLFNVSVNVAWRIALQHPRGLLFQVWLFEKHGGLAGARRLADQIAQSFA